MLSAAISSEACSRSGRRWASGSVTVSRIRSSSAADARAGYRPDARLLSSAAVSKVCASCGKKPSFGNNRSHSMVATRRRFNPNLQKVRVLLNGVAKRAYVCTKCLKAGKVQKAV
jgi:large subunit ribosomal protein L28